MDRGAGVPLRRRLVLRRLSYTQLLVVSILGFLVFGEVPEHLDDHRGGLHRRSGLYTAIGTGTRSQLLQVEGEPSPNA